MEIALTIFLIAVSFAITVLAAAVAYDWIKATIEEWRRKP